MIFVDDREPVGIAVKLKAMKVPVISKRLDIGDYLIKSKEIEIPVERKEIDDYLNSIINGRLFDQCHRLASNYSIAFLCIIGNLKLIEEREFRKEAFIGSLVSVALRRDKGQVIPLLLEDESEFCLALKSINKQVESGEIKTAPRIVRRGKVEDSIAMLMAIPGIGEEKARRLLKLGSVHRIVNATIPELMRVEGIGKKQARRIYDFVRGRKVR
jgi:ERCC4-type nuclease